MVSLIAEIATSTLAGISLNGKAEKKIGECVLGVHPVELILPVRRCVAKIIILQPAEIDTNLDGVAPGKDCQLFH